MKRFGRWVFNTCTALSLLLCVVTAGLWMLSYWRSLELQWTRRTTWSIVDVYAVNGGLVILIKRVPPARQPYFSNYSRGPGITYETQAPFDPYSEPLPLRRPYTDSRLAGVRYFRGEDGEGIYYRGVVLPFSGLTAIIGGMAALALVRGRHIWMRQYRRTNRLCSVCGYDLRATPDRCPECGAVPAKTIG
jgi:hypothetical protein